MKYKISQDIRIVCTLLDLTFSELAKELNVARSTITRVVKGETYPNDLFLEAFYSFAYKNKYRGIKLNALKSQFNQDRYSTILFHASKETIDGEIDLNHSRNDIDMGTGFYLGESFEQAASYAFPFKKSSIYIFDASKLSKLKTKEYKVDLEWMLTISYFRGQLSQYLKTPVMQNIIKGIDGYDVIIAPIADNNMYDIMNRFARGDITDLQAISALSASHLGKQHVLKTEKACKSLVEVDRLYLSNEERKDIEDIKREESIVSTDKMKISIESYRRQGKYIEEIMNELQ